MRFSFVSANVSLTSNSDGVREREYNFELNSMTKFRKLRKFPVLQSFEFPSSPQTNFNATTTNELLEPFNP